jgi:hypothetical protein
VLCRLVEGEVRKLSVLESDLMINAGIELRTKFVPIPDVVKTLMLGTI